MRSAISIARIEDAHTLLIVSAGISFGSPAPIAAWRAGACPAPACSTCPMITYSGSWASRPRRSSAAWITIEPRLVASCEARPPPSFPNGVRTAETITDLAITGNLAALTSHAVISTDLLTPLGAYLRLRGSGEAAFLLESVEHGRLGQFSWVGVGSRLVGLDEAERCGQPVVGYLGYEHAARLEPKVPVPGAGPE